MYLSDSIPSGYKYIYDVGDNYIMLTDEKYLESGDNLVVYTQYLEPSWLCLEMSVANKRDITLVALPEDSISSSDFSRADFPEIFISGMVLLFFILFIINMLSRLVHKGGVFFGQ